MSCFTGSLDVNAITQSVTEGLIEQFDCTFARIWLVEPDRKYLKLVASSGLYTRLDGSFAQVPMGAFKVGKIAQHMIPFLSDSLPDEAWVKDRDWAIKNNIKGFAGLPLIAEQQPIGVLAIFSHTAMEPEFLEVLQMLCLSISIALAGALNHNAYKAQQVAQNDASATVIRTGVLSEQLAAKLGHQKLSLLGVERPVTISTYKLLIEIVDYLSQLTCHYCRLLYDSDMVVLEAMLSAIPDKKDTDEDQIPETLSSQTFSTLCEETQRLGGTVQRQGDDRQTMVELRWQLPHSNEPAASSMHTSARLSSPLSEREQEVLGLLAVGLRDREISEKLYISERTVKFHTRNTLAKLGVKTRTHAVFVATKQGWL